MSTFRKTTKLSNNDPKFKAFRKYAIGMMEKHEVRHLFKLKKHFKKFWIKYSNTFDVPLSEIMNAEKMPVRARNYLLRVKSEGNKKIKDVKEVNNSIVISYQDRRKKKTSNRLKTETSQEIDVIDTEETTITDTLRREKKKIVEVNFSSPITVATVKRITHAVEFKELLTRDYMYYLQGGEEDTETLEDGTIRQRLREQLSHLEITRHVKKEIKILSDRLLIDIESVSLSDLTSYNRKLDIFNKIVSNSRALDMQSVDFLSKMSDDDFNTQKALNGAITNDQMMINNGQVVVPGVKKKELTSEDMSQDLKDIGAAVFDQQLDLIGEATKDDNVIEGDLLPNI